MSTDIRSNPLGVTVRQKPRSNVYTVLLTLSLLALIMACTFLWMDIELYKVPIAVDAPPVEAAPAATEADAAAEAPVDEEAEANAAADAEKPAKEEKPADDDAPAEKGAPAEKEDAPAAEAEKSE